MLKILITGVAIWAAVITVSCGGATNSANTNANTSGPIKVDSANMPPGFSANAIQPSGNSTPGIPSALTNLPKGVTPTPGIPDPANMNKPMKRGATPTPGIPSPEELKRQMSQPPNFNAPPPVNSKNPGMMKKRQLNSLQ